ncbi:MAG: HEAT repeat domain-containing protein [Planctomycetota bacterium]
MKARSTCLLVALLGPLSAQDQGTTPERELSPREIGRQAAKRIKDVAREDDVEAIVEALRETGRIDDVDVVRAVGGLVKDERAEVRWAAIRCLRFNPNEKAGSELIAAAKRKDIADDPAMLAEVLRGIGQHRDPRALRMLAEGFGPKREPTQVAEARIDAVGRIQTPDAVDTLVKFARSGFVAKDLEERIATALAGQTGEELGVELRPWVLWWTQSKQGYRFPEEERPAPAAWARIWSTPTTAGLFARDGGGSDGRPTTGEGGRRRGGEERPGAGSGGTPAGGARRGGD